MKNKVNTKQNKIKQNNKIKKMEWNEYKKIESNKKKNDKSEIKLKLKNKTT